MHNETPQTVQATPTAEPTIRERFAAADIANNAAVKARLAARVPVAVDYAKVTRPDGATLLTDGFGSMAG